MFKSLQKFRETVNLKLYGSKERVSVILNYFSMLVSLVVIGSLVYYYGYPVDRVNKSLVLKMVNFSLGFYVLKYIIGYIYSFQPVTYFKETRWEGVAIALIIVNGLSILIFKLNLIEWIGNQLHVDWFNDFIIGFIQLYLLFLVSLEIGRSTTVFNRVSISPPMFFVLSLFFLIAVGTVLLMLPEMSQSEKSVPFFDAVFTSISAACITGLSVIDIGTVLSFKGQVVLLFLIQLGGLNIITFATMLAYLARNGIGLRFQSVLQSTTLANSPEKSNSVFKQMIIFVLIFEVVGTIMIYNSIGNVEGVFYSKGERLYFSLFHSISAFNNAGFSLLPDSLATGSVVQSLGFHWVIGVLILIGAFGYSNMGDIFPVLYKKIFRKEKWVKFRLDTKISAYAFTFLLITAIVLILMLEYDGLLSGMGAFEKFTASFFQAATLRSAGFNSIDIGFVSTALVVCFIFFMFIGGAPGSTGGGIKTNTFVLLLVSGYSIIRGKSRLEMFKYTISTDLLQRALAIFLFSLSLITFGIFALTILEPGIPFVDLMFEEVSAFCNVGLSRGITAELSTPARIVIMVSMMVGRMGALTLAFALLKPKKYKNYKYPSAHVTVG